MNKTEWLESFEFRFAKVLKHLGVTDVMDLQDNTGPVRDFAWNTTATTLRAKPSCVITDQMVDRAERWLCGHDAWELPYGSTGSGEAARTILEAALADPPVRGSADGMVEPGPPKPLVPDMQAYESLSGLVQQYRGEVEALDRRVDKHSKMVADVNNGYGGIRDQLTYLRKAHDAHERDLEAFSVDLQKVSQEMTALRERVEGIKDGLFKHRHGVHEGKPSTDHPIIDLNAMIAIQGDPARTTPPPTTEPSDPGAGDAEKWEAVADARAERPPFDTDGRKTIVVREQHIANAKAAVNEAVRQGLVQRIDPDDPEQVRVVERELHQLPCNQSATARRILTALKGGAR